MKSDPRQSDIVGLVWFTGPPRAHRLCRVIRVNDCAAVVLMNRPPRVFKTRFDKSVRFQQPPHTFRISSHADVEVLNRSKTKKQKAV